MRGMYGQVSSNTVSVAETITLGGAAQVALLPANRKRLLIMNPWAAVSSESLWIHFDAPDLTNPDGSITPAAAAASPSLELKPGDVYREDGLTSNNQLSVYAATTGHTFALLYSL